MNNAETDEFPKLSRKEILILEMLLGKGEMFGLEMVEASEGGLKRGTIYVTLQRMADKNYVDSREEPRNQPEIGIPRRKYKATGLGERVYQANAKALEFFNTNLVWRESN
jgi:PadR family transcriptional regulator, regulatory protein PadR